MRKNGAALLTLAVCMLAAMCWPGRAEAASKVKLNATKKTVYIGTPYTLKVSGTQKEAKWSSSNKKVATVSQKGTVKGKKKGTATITAKVGSKKLKWSTSDKKVATVTQQGVVKAVGNGSCYVYATAADRGKVKAKCLVKVAVKGSAKSQDTCDHNWVVVYKNKVVPTEYKDTACTKIVNGTNLKVTYVCSCGKKFCGSNAEYEKNVAKRADCVRVYIRSDDKEPPEATTPQHGYAIGNNSITTDAYNKLKEEGCLDDAAAEWMPPEENLNVAYPNHVSRYTAEWCEGDDTGYEACMEHINKMEQEKGESHNWTVDISYDPAPEIARVYTCTNEECYGLQFNSLEDFQRHAAECAGTHEIDDAVYYYENQQVKIIHNQRQIFEEARLYKVGDYFKCSKCGKRGAELLN